MLLGHEQATQALWQGLLLSYPKEYAAPEILEDVEGVYPDTWDAACDMWSLGVILYSMSFGCLPFRSSNSSTGDAGTRTSSLIDEIKNFERVTFPVNHGRSSALVGMISALMSRTPQDRPSTSEILNSKFMRNIHSFTTKQTTSGEEDFGEWPLTVGSVGTAREVSVRRRSVVPVEGRGTLPASLPQSAVVLRKAIPTVTPPLRFPWEQWAFQLGHVIYFMLRVYSTIFSLAVVAVSTHLSSSIRFSSSLISNCFIVYRFSPSVSPSKVTCSLSHQRQFTIWKHFLLGGQWMWTTFCIATESLCISSSFGSHSTALITNTLLLLFGLFVVNLSQNRTSL